MIYIVDEVFVECFENSLKLNKKHANKEGIKLIDEMLEQIQEMKNGTKNETK